MTQQAETLTVAVGALTPADAVHLLVATEQPSLRANRDRRADTVREMLRAFKLDSQDQSRD